MTLEEMQMSTDFEASIKSKSRVKNNGEVFTPKKTVIDMCNMDGIKECTYNIESTILEPSCGTGNFLVELIDRKMHTVDEVSTDKDTYVLNLVKSLTTLYGVDIAYDNILESRDRMKDIVLSHYKVKFNEDLTDEKVLNTIDFVLTTNIILGDMLKSIMLPGFSKKHGAYELKGNETPLVFTEFVFDGENVTMNECQATNIDTVSVSYKPIHFLDMQNRKQVIATGGVLEIDEDGEIVF